VLFPFVPASSIDEPLVEGLRRTFGRFPPFRFALRELRRFVAVLYLAPEPSRPFRELTEAIATRYPTFPPYGGEIPASSIVPHLTVAQGADVDLDEVEAAICGSLPIVSEAREVALLEETEPYGKLWRVRVAFPLGEAGHRPAT
jgi:hypothetical protein